VRGGSWLTTQRKEKHMEVTERDIKAACRAIAKNPETVISLLSSQQVLKLATVQIKLECKKHDYESVMKETRNEIYEVIVNHVS
jgi:predicted RND superfamily exporter protein